LQLILNLKITNNIKFTVNKDDVLEIYDSFLNFDDDELFFVRGINFDLKWCKVSSIPSILLESYRISKNKGRSTSTCNTDKTAQYTCEMKVKTCGLLLACTPCNIILNVKEFYGAESCSQVALFYLETRKNFKGSFLFFVLIYT
jgi:hypothetical protein